MKMSNKRLYTFTEVKISESASFIIEIYYLLGCFPLIYPKSISDRLSQLKTIMSYKCICIFDISICNKCWWWQQTKTVCFFILLDNNCGQILIRSRDVFLFAEIRILLCSWIKHVQCLLCADCVLLFVINEVVFQFNKLLFDTRVNKKHRILSIAFLHCQSIFSCIEQLCAFIRQSYFHQ